MRVGCFGCFSLIVVILIVAIGAAGFIFLSANIFESPEVAATQFSRADGHTAQQKLFELVLRDSGRSSRQDPVVLTEREASALVSRHLTATADLPFSPLSVRFTKGQFELQGRTPARNLMQGPPFPLILPYLPGERLDRPIWVTLKGRVVLEQGAGQPYARTELTEMALGKQPIGTWILYLALGQTGMRLRRLPVPGVVQDIQIEDGRAIIRTR